MGTSGGTPPPAQVDVSRGAEHLLASQSMELSNSGLGRALIRKERISWQCTSTVWALEMTIALQSLETKHWAPFGTDDAIRSFPGAPTASASSFC